MTRRVLVLALVLFGGACAQRGRTLPAPIPAVKGPTRTLAALEAIEIRPGTGRAAGFGTCVYAHYTGWLTDGTKFDSSRDTTARGTPREPIVVPIGFRRVILGWDVGFDGLQVGGQRRLIIPPQFAYGPLGRPPVVPPAATLIFDIELLAVRDTLARAPGAAVPGCTPWSVVAADSTRSLLQEVVAEGKFIGVFFHDILPEDVPDLRLTMQRLAEFRSYLITYAMLP